MRVAIVGCGFVADFYAKSLRSYPELELVGAADRDPERAARFSTYHSVPLFSSLERLLEDSRADIVLNLTNPAGHYSVSKACLEAGIHVYSEKPLATELTEARELVALAESKGLRLSAAPCSLLGEAAQTLWAALRRGEAGRVHLAYAQLDESPIHRMNYRDWRSASGANWPYRDVFKTGCVLESAGYAISWLAAFFGPATAVTAFSTCLIPDKDKTEPLPAPGPDFSVAAITFSSGTTARLTCGSTGSRDRSLRIFGENGILCAADVWDYRSPVYKAGERKLFDGKLSIPWNSHYELLGRGANGRVKYDPSAGHRMDFGRGPAELAEAVREGRPCRLSARFALHVTEVSLAVHRGGRDRASTLIESTFDSIPPMPWAGEAAAGKR